MVDDARVVLPRSKHVAHASLIHVELTKLRYLALVLLALVEFKVLGCRLDMSLECFALLGLGWLRLMHLIAARHQPLVKLLLRLAALYHYDLLRLLRQVA